LSFGKKIRARNKKPWVSPPNQTFDINQSCYDQGFLFKFLRYVDWQLSGRGVSQIWLEIREKSSNFLKPR
jgi:hypothetical protein